MGQNAPPLEYFQELIRVSKNQIIWGANHFISRMPIDSSCWIVWDKENGNNGYADCELAWTSFDKAVRKFQFRWQGMLQGNMKHKEQRIHPTQKPVALYGWLLNNFAHPGDKILDTHLGSGSISIAVHDLGFEMLGIELDKKYYNAAKQRLLYHQAQLGLF
jgi:site-specific DNA-methyltransferase (adenine-specific)